MHVIRAADVTGAFCQATRLLLTRGNRVSPRGLSTLEMSPVTLVFPVIGPSVLAATGRVINPAFAVAETLWAFEGVADPWVVEYNQSLRGFMDDGVLRGAYGPRLRRWGGQHDQLAHTVDRLRADGCTRRAVLQFWDPSIDLQDSRDVACTLSMRFLLRDDHLHGFVTMRSQDIWWGFPYDLHLFSMLLALTAYWLGVEPGLLHHSVDSLHIYERHWGLAKAVADPGRHFVATPIGSAPAPEVLTAFVRGLRDPSSPLAEGEPWRSMQQVLRSYSYWRHGERHAAGVLQQQCGEPYRRALARWYDLLKAGHGP